MSRKTSDPTDGERQWIADNLARARTLTADAGISLPDGVIDPATLDLVWANRFNTPRSPDDDPNPVINALAIDFGQYLVDRLGLEWKVVQDDLGTDLAIVGTPGDILVYPANLVAKRYERAEQGFFAAMAKQIEDRVSEVRTAYRGGGVVGRFRRRRRGD